MGKREHIYEIIAENIRKERIRLGLRRQSLQNGRMYHWIKVSCETDSIWYVESQMKYLSTV